MATVTISVNASKTHLSIVRAEDTACYAIASLAFEYDPLGGGDVLVVRYAGKTVLECLTADTNLAGANTAARLASLFALL